MYRIMLGVMLVLLMFMLAVPVVGLSDGDYNPPEPVEPAGEVFGVQAVDEITPADEAVRTLLDVLYAIVYVPMAAPLIVILVNLMKTVPFLDRFSSQMLAFVWNAVIWIIFTLLNEVGYGGYFESLLGTITTLATLLLGIFGSQMAAGKLYRVARDDGMPVMGYRRSEVTVG